MNDLPDHPITRLAPSPTGALHLGNARTFLVNWALAKQLDWRILLRIEDLDTPRVKPGVIDETVETLRWLGLDWDERVSDQSSDLEPYRDAMRALASSSCVYPCALTRAEIAQATAGPQALEHEDRFPPELRPTDRPRSFEPEDTNWRFVTEPESVCFNDAVAGPQSIDPSGSVGDFAVWTQRSAPSYQLAVMVDDLRQGVNRVVRGDDLIDSTGRQILLRRALGVKTDPVYYHLPLVRGSDGRRLAKRHGDTRLSSYRASHIPRERVVGLIAGWSGMERRAMSAEDFASGFRLHTMPREDITLSPEDERWLHE